MCMQHSRSNAETLDLFDMLFPCLQVFPIAVRIFNAPQKTLLLTHTAMWGFNNKTFLAVACANRLTKHFQVYYLVFTCYCFKLRWFLSSIFSSAFTDAYLLHSTLLYCNMPAWKVCS